MQNPDAWILAQWPWRIAGALTLRGLIKREDRNEKMFVAALGLFEQMTKVKRKMLHWYVSIEIGRIERREHFHFLLGGFPPDAVTRGTCRLLRECWRGKGGGFSEIHFFDAARDLAYVTKAAGALTDRTGGPWYSQTILLGNPLLRRLT